MFQKGIPLITPFEDFLASVTGDYKLGLIDEQTCAVFAALSIVFQAPLVQGTKKPQRCALRPSMR